MAKLGARAAVSRLLLCTTFGALLAGASFGGSPAAEALPGNGPAAPGQLEPAAPAPDGYLQYLAARQTASVADLTRVVARLSGVRSDWGPAREPNEQVLTDWLAETNRLLAQRGIVRDSDKLRPEADLTRGTASLLFVRALRLRGGLAGRWFGLTRRSAYRDLLFAEVMPEGGDRYPMSGTELLSVFQKARERQQSWGGSR